MSESLVTITNPAVSKLRDIMARESKQNSALHVTVVRTHCMGGRGYGYQLALEDSPGEDGVVLEQNGIKVYVDQASRTFLKGAEIDYIDTLMEAGFKIDNPNAISKCPCGHHDIFEGSVQPVHLGHESGPSH